jgi:hypothetical protein
MKLTSVQITNYKSFIDTGKIALGDITLLLGRNNSGKSAIINSLLSIQEGSDVTGLYIRKNETESNIFYYFDSINIDKHADHQHAKPLANNGQLLVKMQTVSGNFDIRVSIDSNANNYQINRTKNTEPDNIFYPFLAKRKVGAYHESFNRNNAVAVTVNLQNLHAKVSRLSNPTHPSSEEYKKLCMDVLGFYVTAHPSAGGQQAGIAVGKTDHIPIDHMGEGVPNILGLITDLCIAEGQIFLIEELENDIHPKGLKSLLDVIAEKSKNNQFIISTHSNIVVKLLGSSADSKIYNITLELEDAGIPISHIAEVGHDMEARSKVLEELGYELYDYDLWDGWLILEESTAERYIRDVLIPLFAPKLSRIRSLAVGGTSKAEPTFEDFRRLFLFSNLEPKYKNKAWVILDGDTEGKKAVESLQKNYSSWQPSNFRIFSKLNFEEYYPSKFNGEVAKIGSMGKKDKRVAKASLIADVIKWCDSTDKKTVISEVKKSSDEVIKILVEIEKSVFPVSP